jgi:hypothetical protein
MSNRNEWLTLRLTAEERRRLEEAARERGYRAIAQFARASLGRSVTQTETIAALESLEKRQAATLAVMRTENARLLRTEYVLFAMIENLAKTILTYLPPPPVESKAATIALGRAAFERYLKAVGMSLHNGATVALERLAEE